LWSKINRQVVKETRYLRTNVEELLSYVREAQRVCPKPDKWRDLWLMLPDRISQGSGWNPPSPLILAAWWETSDEQKRERLELHIRYASEKGVLDEVNKFLRSIKPNEWIYEGEV
jgi:hypothetical protein